MIKKTISASIIGVTVLTFGAFNAAFAEDDTIKITDGGGSYYAKSPESYRIKVYGAYLCDTIKCDNYVLPLSSNASGVVFDIASVNAGAAVGSFLGSGLDLKKLPPKGTTLRYVMMSMGHYREIKGEITIPAGEFGNASDVTCYTKQDEVFALDGWGTGTANASEKGYSKEQVFDDSELDSNGKCLQGGDGCSATSYFYKENGRYNIVYPLVSSFNVDLEQLFDDSLPESEKGKITVEDLNLPPINFGIQIKRALRAYLDGSGNCMISEDNPIILVK